MGESPEICSITNGRFKAMRLDVKQALDLDFCLENLAGIQNR